MSLRSATAMGAVALSIGTVMAGPPAPLVNDAPRPTINVPRASVAPQITADPDDPAWADAATIDDMSASLKGKDDTPPSREPDPSRIHLLWDADYLYVRFDCRDRSIDVPYGEQRDANHYQGDVVELFLDPVGDGRQWFELQVNPEGGILDLLMLMTEELRHGEDLVIEAEQRAREHWSFRGYDIPGLRTGARVVHEPTEKRMGRWIVDVAFPAGPICKRLPHNQLKPMTLRANLLRYDGPFDSDTGKRTELIAANWAPVRHGMPHVSPAAMGYLRLVDRPASSPEQ